MKLHKVLQRVECDLPEYEGVYVLVWVNAPNRVFDEWNRLRENMVKRDENGKVLYVKDENGEEITDDNFQPIPEVDEEAVKKQSRYFIEKLAVEFGIHYEGRDEPLEDDEGPLQPGDPSFVERIDGPLLEWVMNAVADAVAERRKGAKNSVRLAGTSSLRSA